MLAFCYYGVLQNNCVSVSLLRNREQQVDLSCKYQHQPGTVGCDFFDLLTIG